MSAGCECAGKRKRKSDEEGCFGSESVRLMLVSRIFCDGADLRPGAAGGTSEIKQDG